MYDFPPRIRKTLLPFLARDLGEFESQPQEIFKPHGLILWNAPEMSVVETLLIGNSLELVAGIGPIPAKWFSIYESYEQIWESQLDGKEPAGWTEFHTVSIGMIIKLRMSAHKDFPVSKEAWDKVQVLMWGLSV
jgi:hypothetical protein